MTHILHLSVAVLCVTASGLYFHILHLWYRGKRRHPTKYLWYYLVFKEKQLRCENYFYRVLIIVRGMNMSWNPLIHFFVVPFLSDVYLSEIFNRFIPLLSVMLLHAFPNLHMWLLLFCVWCLTCWVRPTKVYNVWLYLIMCIIRADTLNEFGISLLCQNGSLVYVS